MDKDYAKLVAIHATATVLRAPKELHGKRFSLLTPDRREHYQVTILPRKAYHGEYCMPVFNPRQAAILQRRGWTLYDGEIAPFGWHVIDEAALPKPEPAPVKEAAPEKVVQIEPEPAGKDWLHRLRKTKENRQRILNLLGIPNVRQQGFDELKGLLAEKYPDMTFDGFMECPTDDI